MKNKELKERINQRDKNSDAALHVASHSGHINIVKVRDKHSDVALHVASHSGHINIVKVRDKTVLQHYILLHTQAI